MSAPDADDVGMVRGLANDVAPLSGRTATGRGSVHELLAIIDHLPAMVAYWDGELRNRVANRAYIEWFGVTPEAMHGIHIRDLLGPALFEANRPYIEGALAGTAQEFQRTLTTTSGAVRHTQASYVPDIVGGEVRGFFVLVADITERVKAERALAHSAEEYRSLVRSLPGGFVLLFDRDLRFAVGDGEALPIFGYHRETIEGRTVHEAFPAALAEELEPRYRSALAGTPVTWERMIGDRAFSLTAAPVRDTDGTVFAGTVVCHEITAERRSRATADALKEVATLVADHATPAAVARWVAKHLRVLFALEQTSVVRFDPPDGLELLASDPPLPSELGTALRVDESSAVAAIVRSGAPEIVAYDEHAQGTIGRIRRRGLRIGAAAPVRVHDQLWGAIAIGSTTPAAIDALVLERLASFAQLVEIAIGNAEAWEALSRQADTDPLTGLADRRAFTHRLKAELARARRYEHPLSLVLFDLDHFKQVNDRHGHPAGDRVLKELAHRLVAMGRASETIARIGGEEFAWLLPETDMNGALAAAERARAAIAARPFPEIGSLTVSAGVSSLATGGSAEDLVEQADEALYQAKRNGRNRTVASASTAAARS